MQPEASAASRCRVAGTCSSLHGISTAIHAEQQFTPRATRGAAQLHLPVLRFLCIALQRGGCREWINARRRMPRRSGRALGVGNDQPGASTARKRPSVGSERSLNCTVFRLQPEVFHGVTLVCPCAREVKACDLAVRTGREGGIEMLNCEGRGPGRSCRRSRCPYYMLLNALTFEDSRSCPYSTRQKYISKTDL